MLFSTPLDSAWFVFLSDTSMGKNLLYCPKLFKWDQNLRCTPLRKRWSIPSYSHGSVQGRIQDFFLEGGALVSCSTSTPINHIVFFWQNTSCIRKPQVISGGRGVCTPCTLPRSAPAWKCSSRNKFLSISPPHATSKKWQVLPGLQGQLDEASSSFQSKNIRARKHGKNFRGTSNNNGNWMSRTLLSQYKLAAFMADTYDTKTHYNVTKDWRPTHICEREAKNTQVCQYITIHY